MPTSISIEEGLSCRCHFGLLVVSSIRMDSSAEIGEDQRKQDYIT